MKITAKAHPNIALIKYFGKKNVSQVLPYNDSVSITWDTFETVTSIEDSDTFRFFLNNKEASPTDRDKLKTFLHFFTSQPLDVTIRSQNNFPTAAGLASSASAFAALSVAANRYFKTAFDESTLEAITRKGSGSAVRSLRGGANRFNRDGHVYPINAPIEDYRLFVVLINVQKKPFSSREAMRRTVLTSSLYKPFVDTANRDADALEAALKNGDFKTVGKLSEKSALSMHGTLLASNPPIQFLLRDSIKVIESIKRLREDEGIGAFFTMDAGPNIKVLTTHKDVERLQRALKSLDHEILGPLTPSMEGAHIL